MFVGLSLVGGFSISAQAADKKKPKPQNVADHYRAVRATLACRTPEMGGRLYRCGDCQRTHFAYHSCNHRNCPQCGALDRQIWSARQEARLLPVPYFMVTFTLPSELRSLCLGHPQVLYDLILRCSAAALRVVVASKLKAPNVRIGSTAVLHTWGRQMQHHPHVHRIVSRRQAPCAENVRSSPVENAAPGQSRSVRRPKCPHASGSATVA